MQQITPNIVNIIKCTSWAFTCRESISPVLLYMRSSQMNQSQMPISHYCCSRPSQGCCNVRVIIHRIAKPVHLTCSHTDEHTLAVTADPWQRSVAAALCRIRSCNVGFFSISFSCPASALFSPAIWSLPWIHLFTCATKPQEMNSSRNNIPSLNTATYAGGVNGSIDIVLGREQSSHSLSAEPYPL